MANPRDPDTESFDGKTQKDSLADSFFCSHAYFSVVAEAVVAENTRRRNAAVAELNASGLAPEKVLEMYHTNLSLQEIAKTLDRSEKWVKTNLTKFGVRFSGKGARLLPGDIPYGWKESSVKLVPNDAEQWLLEKAVEDLKEGVSADDIARSFNSPKVQPRAGRKWIGTMTSKCVSDNRRLKAVLLRK